MEYIDAESKERFIPYVVETALGVGRLLLVALVDAYQEEDVEGEKRVVLKLHPSVAPIKAGIFPLVKKDGMPEIAQRIHADLQKRFRVFYDDGGSIGRRYRRQDEAGTPFGLTVDGQTLEDQTVTVRDRDTLRQERVATDQLIGYLAERVVG
jgi:glycyl-tRNA synthetase